MRLKTLFVFVVTLLFMLSCRVKDNADNTEDKESPKRDKKIISRASVFKHDLDEIIKDDTLKVLITYSGTSYFLYKGRPMGFEYELLEKFASNMNLKVKLKIVSNIDSVFYCLKMGDADLVAHGITETMERKKDVSFTEPLYSSHQVLVQKMPDNWYDLHWKKIDDALLHDAIELIGDTVSVRANSSYYQRLINLSNEIGGEIVIDTLSGGHTTDEIIEMVVSGQVKYTVADKNIASLLASYYPVLNIDVPLSTTQNIGWVTRKSSPKLLDAINKWLVAYKKKAEYHVIYNKYYKNKKDFKRRVDSELYSLNENKISKYDSLIKEEAEKIGWDWRLLASQVYQESRFNPSAVSWAGAVGLMQMMPATAKEFGVHWRSNPEQSLVGGVKYLSHLTELFADVDDPVQKIKFTIASYNCGYGHVSDARSLAGKYRLDPNVWDGNVEKMILSLRYPKEFNDPVVKHGYLRGIEPYTYVKQIFERYEHYKRLVK